MKNNLQRKSADELPPIIVTRFVMPDMQKYGQWLLDALREKWPLDERNIYSFLRGCMESREFFFVKTDHAVGLAQITHSPLSAVADVTEIFVKVEDRRRLEYVREGAGLYGEFRRWAKSMSARELIVERFTDVPTGLIADALGHVESREVSYLRLGE
jgi:hypothetical protein